jgi:hypothetical protein
MPTFLSLSRRQRSLGSGAPGTHRVPTPMTARHAVERVGSVSTMTTSLLQKAIRSTPVCAVLIGAVIVGGCGGPAALPSAQVGGAPPSVKASPSPSVSPTIAPSPGPSLLARGNFTAHGIRAELDATGGGADVAGTMVLSQSNTENRATVDLDCARTTADGLIEIGGLVTDSTFDADDQDWHEGFPEGRGVVIIFEPGSPVKGIWWVSLADQPVASCAALFESLDSGDEILPGSPGLDPIQGTVEFGQ